MLAEVLLSAGYMSYLGPLPGSYRKQVGRAVLHKCDMPWDGHVPSLVVSDTVKRWSINF